jgi:pyrroloquinoline quinone biosynthesis protein B
MSDIPHPYVEESIELFKDLSDSEKAKVTFIHFNHTNPLILDSPERKEVEALGFNVAREGMEIDL